MAIEIVDLPIKHGDFRWFFVNVYQAGCRGVGRIGLLPRAAVGACDPPRPAT